MASTSESDRTTADGNIRYSIPADDIDPTCLFGPADANLNAILDTFKTRISVRDGIIRLQGPPAERQALIELFNRLKKRCRSGQVLQPDIVRAEIAGLTANTGADQGGALTLRTPRKLVVAKTPNQHEYLRAIANNDIVLGIGPAGTGKTYLAVAAAVAALSAGACSRLVLTRPAVEAGESLGYLPGTFKEKIDPYLRPLYDALFDMMSLERARQLIEQELIEVAPLAFMRGRTLSDAYIILDEAQNTTSSQMKMFLTRLGWNSKAIVTGDITQIDLAHQHISGLIQAERLLSSIEGIAIVHFDRGDVVRPPLVSKIIRAYENGEPKNGAG
ncbi:MAG: PhoH family protein [candidate division WOR-3 bacterium]